METAPAHMNNGWVYMGSNFIVCFTISYDIRTADYFSERLDSFTILFAQP